VAALLALRALRRRVAGLVLLAPISTKAEMVEAVEAVELGEKLAPEEGQLLGVGELVTGISKSVWIFHGESNWIWDTAETVPPNFRERPNGCAQNIVAGGITCMGKNSWSRNG